ncbi:cytochrome P450 7B1 isoform X1 [Pantherophis guttatus]|uniref:Cytochrome P450 7B1 isoform X1 n=2 Tax=Pantherophis guttatus TaxID=94885 RepID=A0A6P9CMR9_PANGU|nr:cytochrome P450 7B1 isoform X1 [Pantherophis guttatus]
MGLMEWLPFGVYGLALATALAFGALCAFGRRKRLTGEPPLINGWIPFLGEALNFRKNAIGFLLTLNKKHGDIFTVHMAGKYITFILNPLQYPVVTKNSKYLEFEEFADQLSSQAFDHPPVINGKCPDLNERVHRNYQHLLGKSLDTLSDNVMRNLQIIFKRKFSQMVDWEMGKMHKFCFSIIFEASFKTLFGRDPHNDGYNVTDEIGEKFLKFDANFSYLALNIPIVLLGATKKIRRELLNFLNPKKMEKWLDVSEVVQDRKDIFENYTVLSDYDKAAHHFTFLWASVANTIPGVFWAIYYLLRHPEAFAVVRDEIDHLLQSTGQEKRPGDSIYLSREQLDNLVYLESAINESLRMCSSSMNIRKIKENFILSFEENNEVCLRKGDLLAIFPPILHMDPEIYEDPQTYKFDRYVENGKKKTTFFKQGKKLKYFLMPFGSGSSMCPGRFFAMNEIKVFVILALVYFDMDIIEDKQLGQGKDRIGLGILLPDSDIIFRYKLRS